MTRLRAYLDHNASTPLLPAAREAIVSALALPGNPSSIHAEGRALRAIIEAGRKSVADAAGAERAQVVFTGSATEALTQAIVGGAQNLDIECIIVSAGEHLAVLQAAKASNLPVQQVGLDADGVIDFAQLEALLAAADDAGQKALVGVHWVNNETGVVQPIDAIARLVGPTAHYLLVDAVQAFGKMNLDFAASAADMMAISAHKMGGPAGIGALLMKGHCDQVRLVPGGGQEMGRRGGTESAALIAGFGAAAEHFSTAFDASFVHQLVGQVAAAIAKLDANAHVFGGANRLGHVLCFALPGIRAEIALMKMDLAGIAISSGSACSSGKVKASHVLKAMGVDDALGDCALRVSFGWNSTEKDVQAFVDALETLVNKQRARAGCAA